MSPQPSNFPFRTNVDEEVKQGHPAYRVLQDIQQSFQHAGRRTWSLDDFHSWINHDQEKIYATLLEQMGQIRPYSQTDVVQEAIGRHIANLRTRMLEEAQRQEVLWTPALDSYLIGKAWRWDPEANRQQQGNSIEKPFSKNLPDDLNQQLQQIQEWIKKHRGSQQALKLQSFRAWPILAELLNQLDWRQHPKLLSLLMQKSADCFRRQVEGGRAELKGAQGVAVAQQLIANKGLTRQQLDQVFHLIAMEELGLHDKQQEVLDQLARHPAADHTLRLQIARSFPLSDKRQGQQRILDLLSDNPAGQHARFVKTVLSRMRNERLLNLLPELAPQKRQLALEVLLDKGQGLRVVRWLKEDPDGQQLAEKLERPDLIVLLQTDDETARKEALSLILPRHDGRARSR